MVMLAAALLSSALAVAHPPAAMLPPLPCPPVLRAAMHHHRNHTVSGYILEPIAAGCCGIAIDEHGDPVSVYAVEHLPAYREIEIFEAVLWNSAAPALPRAGAKPFSSSLPGNGDPRLPGAE